jgi:hypothetical protein
VRPLTDVRLIRRKQLAKRRGHQVQQRSERRGLFRGEVSEAEDVAAWLDDERADTQGAGAVLNEPAVALEDQAAGERCAAVRQVAGEAPFFAQR